MRVFQMFGASSTQFATVDNEGVVHTRGSFGLTDEIAASWHLYPLHLKLPSTEAIRNRKTVWETNLPEWSEHFRDLNKFKLSTTAKSFVTWPIMRGIAPIGSIGFYSDEVLIPSQENEQFLETVGRLVAFHLRFSDSKVSSDPLSTESITESIASLTHRQQAILSQIADHKTNSEIAKELAFSPDTIRLDTIKIYKVFGVTNRVEASELFMRTKS